MKNWMRVVLPRDGVVIFFFVAYLLAVSFNLMNGWLWATEIDSSNPFPVRDIMVMFAACSYGAYRSYGFHPSCEAKYDQFLGQTAWSPAKPLPLGPVHLIWQDVIVVCLLVAAIYPDPFIHPIRPLYGMLFSYHLCLLIIFIRCRVWAYLYVMAFGLGAAALLWANPLFALLILVALNLVGYIGITKSLKELHQNRLKQAVNPQVQSKLESNEHLVGWPFDALAPRIPSIYVTPKVQITKVPLYHGLSISLLSGWLFLCASVIAFQLTLQQKDFWIQHYSDQPQAFIELVPSASSVLYQEMFTPGLTRVSRDSFYGTLVPLFIIIIALGVFRLAYYCKGYHPPISLLGRLLSLRWIIPAYDQVFVAPLCVLLVLLAFNPILVLYLGMSSLYAGPIVVWLAVLITLVMGPKRSQWVLTAPCRQYATYEYKGGAGGNFTQL
ncbi:MAG: hypothetical protein JKY95_11065 [Planctomycetaceae bacterium]|nr:hypothetical protein [Planctomycetaceae bacterium]